MKISSLVSLLHPRRAIASIHRRLAPYLTPPVTAESLSDYYRSAPDEELRRVDPKLLSPMARPLWQAETERRRQALRASRNVA